MEEKPERVVHDCSKQNPFYLESWYVNKDFQKVLKFLDERFLYPSELYFRRFFPFLFLLSSCWTMEKVWNLKFPGGKFGVPKLMVSVPHCIINCYFFLLMYYSILLYCRYRRTEDSSLLKSLSQVEFPIFWKLNLKVYLKNLMIGSQVYLVSKIKEYDDSEESDLKFCFSTVSILHIMYYYLHILYVPTTRELPDIYKYVPSIPSAALLCYSIYRCISSDELRQLGQEEVGLFANNTLLLLMFLYEDFCLKNYEGIRPINFEEENYDCTKFQQKYNQSNCNEKCKYMMQQRLSPFHILCFLFINILFSGMYCFQICDQFYFAYSIPGAFIMIQYNFGWENLRENALTYMQAICGFSLLTEIFPFTLTNFMNAVSAPLLYATVVLFIFKIRDDKIRRNANSISDFSRTVHSSLTLRKPSKDWRWIVESLKYVKNIEKFVVCISDDGSVTLRKQVDEGQMKTDGKTAESEPTLTKEESQKERATVIKEEP